MPEPKTITIAGQQFQVSQPYEEGQTITAAEAKALNQTRSENIRNNMAKAVKEAAAKNEDATGAVTKYDKEYVFTLASVGSVVRDPVEREARSIARSAITAKLREQGRKIKDVDEEKLEAKIVEVAAREDVLKLARKRVADKQKAIDVAGEDLGLAA